MLAYLQTDNRWKNKKLGTCNDTIGKSGCFITCLAMLDGRTPDVIDALLTANGGYADGCLVNPAPTALILGLTYDGKTTTKPDFSCVAETSYFAPNYPQHFFIINPDGSQLDPLGKNIKYPIVSYRLFHEKVDNSTPPANTNPMDERFTEVKAIQALHYATADEPISDEELAYWTGDLGGNPNHDLNTIAADWYQTKVMATVNSATQPYKDQVTELQGQLQQMTTRAATAEQENQSLTDASNQTLSQLREVQSQLDACKKDSVSSLSSADLLRLLINKIFRGGK